jgi:signal transduction histidine kinase
MAAPSLLLGPQVFETIAEYVELGLWIRAHDGALLYANAYLAQLLGLDAPADISPDAWLVRVHPGDRQRLAVRWALGDWHDYRESYAVLTPSGRPVQVEDWVLQVTRVTDAPPLVIGCVRPVVAAGPLSPQPQVTLGNAEVDALLASSRDLTGTLDLDELLRRILDRLQILVGYTGAGIILQEGSQWIARATRLPSDHDGSRPFPVNSNTALVTQILRTRAPHVIDDSARDPAIREDMLSIPMRPRTVFSYIRSWMGAPLSVDGEVIGLLFVDHREPGWFTPERQRTVAAFSDQAAIAVKNARTYQRAQRRLAELTGVQRATRALLETVDLDQILDIACREACSLTRAETSAIFAIDEEGLALTRQHGPLEMNAPRVRSLIQECCETCASQANEAGHRRIEEPGALHQAATSGLAVLAAPLFSQEYCIGAIAVANESGQFGEDEARVLTLLADNVAMAVNGAQLAHEGQQLAVMKERQRLAVELHDTVTQALYSANLLVDATDLAIKGERYAAAAANLQKLQDTVHEAMRGMRVMIFELRPPTLDEGLAVALERRLSAVESRIGMKANLTVHDEVRLGEETEAQIYWIVSEALNNVIKHAHAAHVSVELRYRERELVAQVTDDGAGFDVQAPPGRMGLGIAGMRERAASIGATLAIASDPGSGSCITLTLPLR